MSFGNCEHIDDRPLIIVKENRCKITFRNPSRLQIRRIHIDGCVITEGLRCDYLLINRDAVEHYTELKGSDVRHALQQIEATIRAVGVNSNQRKAFIISTRCPLMTTEIQQKQKYFKKNYNATLVIKNFAHEVDI